MISVYKLKSGFRVLLTPIMRKMHQMGITPNMVTIVAIFLSLIMGVMLFMAAENLWLYLMVAFGFLLRMALNAIDGLMAGTFAMQSRLGEVLNEMGDVLSDTLIYMGLLFVPGTSPVVVIAFVSLSVMNEMAGLMAKISSGNRRYDGPMGKSDRALVIGLLCIGLYCFEGLPNYVNIILIVCCVLMLVSTTVRLKKGLETAI